MQLHLMRHGEANPVILDPEKGLSQKGILITKKIADLLKKQEIHLDIIFTSFKKRALQTSEIMQKGLGNPEIISLSILDPNEDPTELLAYLKNSQEFKSVLIVGHLPFLENLVTLLMPDIKKPIKFENSDFCTFEIQNFDSKQTKFLQFYSSN
ncbi:MAG TPA: phosphohistidine phosphatase SixA [Chlamydiales bacterium]|nr:phosphohistidine phosphatase SixA [Chlamydiales bacterium]